MKTSEFDRLCEAIISPFLIEEQGYSFCDGVFFKSVTVAVRHVIIFDLDSRAGSVFKVMVGFNSPIITEQHPAQAGIFGVQNLSGAGLCDHPVKFPCFSKEVALKSFRTVLLLLKEVVLPWFERFNELGAVVEIIEEQYPFIKGKLLLDMGRLTEARAFLSRHREYLERQVPTASVMQGLLETRDMLQKCVQ